MNADTVRCLFQSGQIDAIGVATLFAEHRLTPLAFTEACLRAAKQSRNIFTTLTSQRARDEAAASTLRWQKGQPLSALDGIPVAWKDLFDLAGTVTTAGSATRQQAPAARDDAPIVTRLTQAGMINIGKTNLSEFAFSGLGLNPAFGTPAIKDDRACLYAPGGSSSGSARAVAEGVACFAMGSDTAGSIRIPAAFNGIVGFRASRHRYDDTGVFPLASSLDTLGPLCRSVRDAQALDEILLEQDSASLEQPRFRVDVDLLDQAQPEVRDNGYRQLDRLSAKGYIIEMKPVRAFHHALAWIAENGWPGAVEAWQLHAPLLASASAEKMDPFIRSRLQLSGQLDPAILNNFLAQRRTWQTAMSEELNGAVLVTPTVAHTAPRLAPLESDSHLFAQVNSATLRLTMPGSLLDMPGIALPSGVDSHGLATSLLFSLPSGDDRQLLMATTTVAETLATDKPARSAISESHN